MKQIVRLNTVAVMSVGSTLAAYAVMVGDQAADCVSRTRIVRSPPCNRTNTSTLVGFGADKKRALVMGGSDCRTASIGARKARLPSGRIFAG